MSNNEKKIFAQNLNYYMAKNNKDQIDLINDLNVNKSTISTWCNGLKMPRMGTIQTLADYFGIMKSDLIEEKKEAPEVEACPLDKEIIELFCSLSEKKQELALEHLKLLAALDE